MLGAIRAVTTTVPDLRAIEDAYTAFLGYRVVDRGTVSDETARGWDAPAVAGRRYIAMLPESGEPTYLRFIESPVAHGYKALTSYGWNATEITVQDPDALAAKLAHSPFRIIGPPANLEGFPTIRAMQVLGPAGECVYLTHVGPGSGFHLAAANSFVGRVFITVLGGADMGAMTRFYDERFGNGASAPVETKITVLSAANNLPTDHKHGLATIGLDDGTLFEIDRYPQGTGPRATIAGELPPGMAIVTCEVDALNGDGFLAPPGASPLPAFAAFRTATVRGAAGELIELIARA